MRHRTLCVFIILAVFVTMGAAGYGQSVAAENALPEPYSADEFPDWARGLRRFEVISVGAFPVLLFYTRVGFDIYRWNSNGRDSKYLPWPFKNEFSYKPTTEAEIAAYNAEQLKTVLIAGALSIVFSGIDSLIRWIPKRVEKRPAETEQPLTGDKLNTSME